MSLHNYTTGEFATILEIALQNDQSILGVGDPGIGKTNIAEQVAAKLGWDIIVKTPINDESPDYKGLPAIIGNKAEFLPYGDLETMIKAEKHTIILLDDLGQVTNPTIQASVMHLLHARKVGNIPISKYVHFVALSNDLTNKAGVAPMIEPLKSRFTSIVRVVADPTGQDWCNWGATHGIAPEVLAFIKAQPQWLFSFKPTTDFTNSACPRTIAAMAKIFATNYPENLKLGLYIGAVGEGCALAFASFLEIINKINVAALLADPVGAPLPKEAHLQYYLLCKLADKANIHNIETIMTIGKRMPSEYVRTMVSKIESKGDLMLVSHPLIIQWKYENL